MMKQIPIFRKISFLQFYLVFCYFDLVLLGFITWALPMEDQDYYLQEIINRNHYYSYPDPNEDLSPFTEQPKEKDLKPSAEIEVSPRFKPGKKEYKSKKTIKPRKDKSTLETPPGNFLPLLSNFNILDGSQGFPISITHT